LLENVDDFAGPGLGTWDLEGLVGHFLRALRTPLDYLERPVSGEQPLRNAAAYYAAYLLRRAEDPNAMDADVAARGAAEIKAVTIHPSVAVRDNGDRLDHLLQITEPDQLIQTLVGPMRFGDYMHTRVMEVVVHGLDIARATQSNWVPASALVAECLDLLTSIALEVDDGIDLLLVLTGRIGPADSEVLAVFR
jgi:hypothetical protein